MPATTLSYGPTPDQVVDLSWPDAAGPFPVVVLVHGGFWREQYQRDLMEPLARDVVGRGLAAANVEYRRVGASGGGWPETFADAAAAIDALADADAPIDTARVVVVGHSAGGHLAAWLASRGRIPEGEVGCAPRVQPMAVVSQAGVVGLSDAARAGVGDGAMQDLMGGGPDDVPDRYAVGDPTALAPPPVPVLLVHAVEDDRVPVGQSRDYARRVGDHAALVEVGGDHFTVIDPADASWELTMDWIGRRLDEG